MEIIAELAAQIAGEMCIRDSKFGDTDSIKTVFAPNLESVEHLPECDGLTIYLSDKFIDVYKRQVLLLLYGRSSHTYRSTLQCWERNKSFVL